MKTIRVLSMGALLSALLCLAPGIRAYDLPPLNLGFTSFLDGGPPAGPGLYFAQYLQYYHAEKFADNDGRNLQLPVPGALPSPRLDAYISLSQFIYQSDQKVLFGGKWGVDVILPIVAFDLQSAFPFEEYGAGMGDLLIGPYLQWDPIMGKKGPIFMHRIEFQCLTPTGEYSPNRELNPGSHFFSFNPYWAGTLFINPKWTTSVRLHYLWNDSHGEPNRFDVLNYGAQEIQAGQAMHLNFATEYEVWPKHMRVGLNGYYLKQITDTEVDGRDIGGRREQVLGIGPGVVYHFSPNNHLFFNTYFELEARNRTEGMRFNLRFVHHF